MSAVHRLLAAAVIAGLILMSGGPADAVPVQCGAVINGLTCGAIVADDLVDWGQLGLPGSNTDDFGYPVFANSTLGNQVMLTDRGEFFTRLDQNDTIGSVTPYAGNFEPNAHLLLNGLNVPLNGPVTIDFLDQDGDPIAILGAGLHVQLNPFVGAGEHNPFTAIITAFDLGGNELASFFDPNGDSCRANDDPTQLDCPFGSALFLGISAPANPSDPPVPQIARIIFEMRNGAAGSGADALLLPESNFAFDQLQIGAVAVAVPEPASIVLVGVGLVAVALGARRRSRR